VATYGTLFGIFAIYKIRKWMKPAAIEDDIAEVEVPKKK